MKKLFAMLAFAVLTATAGASAKADTVKLAVTDLVGLEELQREFGKFVEVLEDATGQEIEFLPVTNRTAAVEALRFGKVDFVLTGPAEYVVMKKRTDAEIVVGFSRPDYFAVLITLADNGYSLPSDLKGQKVAMGSAGSTSKHLGPIQVLADYGLEPLKDVEVIHTKVPVAWEALKRGDVAAMGVNHLKFLALRDKEAEAGGLPPGAFRVIGRGPDLPNDVLMAGKHVDAAIVASFKKAFVERSDDLIAAILTGDDNKKYAGMRFITNIKDSNYNYVRSMYATAGYPEYADFIGN
ncbi:PhnD/SsuA/transferrin family substrate-binding protein [Rhodospirillaceae bacterium KN72]|uniref:PhnD/SsuA/transferrin family substrate-binding protein n=1 Tax=Pacificispira spongiicola TaxID=2729598 RepID=A0A7Y0DYB1_9PROT|nr:PhnD/SsuA/transferrin family substrate-binding protein [Pacificispira spongiicola]NMM43849.1 PhnD/SsuA/transferrin family substrate-binding protein [Pacificispira spongiicola]